MKQVLQRRCRTRRFSLLEVMVVLIIIGLLTALVGPAVIKQLGKGKRKTALTQTKLLTNACKDFYLDMDAYPDSLRELIESPGSEKWDGPYLDPAVIPKDPWGNEYHYEKPGQHGQFDIVSYGADGTSGGDGESADIGNWQTDEDAAE